MRMYAAIIALLLATAAAHVGIVAAQNRSAREAPDSHALRIPSDLGGYRQLGEDIDQGDRVRELLQTSAILMRNYASNSGRVICLAAVHASTSRGSLHFPEVCLVGQGWEIDKQFTAPVGFLFEAKHLVLFSGPHREAVMYWFKTGQNLTGSFFLNSWYWIRDKVRFRSPETTMYRISTAIGGQGEEAAFSDLQDFAVHLAPLVLNEER